MEDKQNQPVVNVVVQQLNVNDEDEWKTVPTRLNALETDVKSIKEQLKTLSKKVEQLCIKMTSIGKQSTWQFWVLAGIAIIAAMGSFI